MTKKSSDTQKRTSDLITDGCEPPCGCWELNSGPREEKLVLLTISLANEVFFVVVLVLFFQDRVSLCSPGCPGTHSVDQAGLELRNLPASASQVLELKVCTTTARLRQNTYIHKNFQNLKAT